MNRAQIQQMARVIVSCFVLHNLLFDLNDDTALNAQEDEGDEEDDDVQDEVPAKRRQQSEYLCSIQQELLREMYGLTKFTPKLLWLADRPEQALAARGGRYVPLFLPATG